MSKCLERVDDLLELVCFSPPMNYTSSETMILLVSKVRRSDVIYPILKSSFSGFSKASFLKCFVKNLLATVSATRADSDRKQTESNKQPLYGEGSDDMGDRFILLVVVVVVVDDDAGRYRRHRCPDLPAPARPARVPARSPARSVPHESTC